MPNRLEAAQRPSDSPGKAVADEAAAGQAAVEDKFSIWPHVIAVAVVVMLFGSIMGPLGDAAVLTIAGVVIGGATLRALSVHGVTSWRTILLGLAIAGVVAVRAYYDPPVTEYGQAKWLNFCTLTLATMVASVTVASRRALRALAGWWVVAGVVLAGLAFLGPAAATGRAQVDDSNPVWLGRAIAASMVIAVWLGVSRVWGWWRVVLVLPLLAAGLLATGSRGPAVAAALGVVFLLLAPSARRSRQAMVVVVLGVGLFILAPLIPAVANSRFGQFLSQGSVNGESRSAMWLRAAKMIPDTPFGVGIGNWAPASGSSFNWPHNLFLELLVEQGWLVGFAFVLLVATLLRRLWRSSGSDPGLQLALALLMTETVHVSTSGDLNARTFFFVLLLGVTLLNKQRFEPTEAGDAPTGSGTAGSSQRVTSSRTAATRVAIARRD